MTDAVIIGLGPAGLVAAHVLSSAGLSVVAIQPEPGGDARDPLASPPPTLRRAFGEEAVLQDAPPAGLDGVGGSKRLAAPQAYRLPDWAMQTRARTLARYGALPTDLDLQDWPVTPEELMPWYERVEIATGVGTRAPSAWTKRMSKAALALGWQPFAAPAAADADSSFLLRDTDVRVLRAAVTGILRGPTGAITGVEYVQADGEARTVTCPAVVVAASVIPSVRLLLLSGIDAGGRVGSWFMAHNAFVVHGAFDGEDLGRRHAGPATAVAVDAFEDDRFDHAGLGFLGGSLLQAAMTGPWDEARCAAAAVGLGADVTDGMDGNAWTRIHHASVGTVWAQPDQFPRAENRIDLDPDHRDALGRPVARITFSLGADDTRRWEHLSDRMAQWLEAAGARATWAPPLSPQPLGTHLYGGLRMGSDPSTSVADSHGRVHGVPGLVVLGSATFPTTGGRGPVETVEALSWRAAQALADDLR